MTPPPPADPPPDRGARVVVTLAALAVLLGALKLTASVTMPLGFALFVVAIFWPLYRWIRPRAGEAVAAVTVLLGFLAFLGAIGGALWYSGQQLLSSASEFSSTATRLLDEARAWAAARDLPFPSSPSFLLEGLSSQLRAAASEIFGATGVFVLVVAFVVLATLEIDDYRAKVATTTGGRDDGDGANGSAATELIGRIAADFRRYFLVRTFIGLVTGVGVALGSWLIGLENPVLWGLANFLLNYIPTLGSIIGVIPPALFALVQFGSLGMAALALFVVGGVQLVMGAWVDPLLQGRYLRLSPLVVLLSVALWGWVWGVPGAFVGVPLTILIVLVTAQFERTRWIAVLLAERDSVPERVAGQHAGEQPRHGPPPEGLPV